MSHEIDDGAPVPANRFKDETRLKRQAQERVAELEQAMAKLEQRVATTDLLSKQLEEVRAKYTADSTAWETERSVYQLGIVDTEAIDVARHFHGRLPEQGRPPLAEWLRAVKEDPSKAPRALVPYLQSAPSAAPTAPAPAASTPAPPAPSPSPSAASSQRPGVTAPAAATTQLDAGQIRALYQEAARTGDWSKWDAIRSSIRGRG